MSNQTAWKVDVIVSNWRHTLSPPKGTSGTVTVVYKKGEGAIGLLSDGVRLEKKDCINGAYEFCFVPLAPRVIRLSERISAKEMGVEFTVNIDLEYVIANPLQVVEYRNQDLDAIVTARVQGQLYKYDRHYQANNPLSLQMDIQERLDGALSDIGVKIANSNVRVHPDERIKKTQTEIFDVQTQKELVEAQTELKLTEIRAESTVRNEQHDRDITERKWRYELTGIDMKFYAEALRKDDPERFALMISEKDSSVVREVVERYVKDHELQDKRRWDLFVKLLTDDDAQLLTSRFLEIARFLDIKTSALTSSAPKLSESSPESLGLSMDVEDDLDELIETWDLDENSD